MLPSRIQKCRRLPRCRSHGTATRVTTTNQLFTRTLLSSIVSGLRCEVDRLSRLRPAVAGLRRDGESKRAFADALISSTARGSRLRSSGFVIYVAASSYAPFGTVCGGHSGFPLPAVFRAALPSRPVCRLLPAQSSKQNPHLSCIISRL